MSLKLQFLYRSYPWLYSSLLVYPSLQFQGMLWSIVRACHNQKSMCIWQWHYRLSLKRWRSHFWGLGDYGNLEKKQDYRVDHKNDDFWLSNKFYDGIIVSECNYKRQKHIIYVSPLMVQFASNILQVPVSMQWMLLIPIKSYPWLQVYSMVELTVVLRYVRSPLVSMGGVLQSVSD